MRAENQLYERYELSGSEYKEFTISIQGYSILIRNHNYDTTLTTLDEVIKHDKDRIYLHNLDNPIV